MELTTKCTIDGIKIPLEQTTALFEMVGYAYINLEAAGTITDGQRLFYKEMQEIIAKMK